MHADAPPVPSTLSQPRAEVRAPALEGHIAALDGVRGMAILLVLAHHLAGSAQGEFQWWNPVTTLLAFGWVGVDLFFVLSGFLITGILFDAKGKDHYFRNFYARRTLRIFPLYYLALLSLELLRASWPELDLYPKMSSAWLWAYVSNVASALYGFGNFGLFDHFWSLAVEEQFYMVWPFVVFSAGRTTLLRVAVGAMVVALALRIGLVLGGADHAAPYALMPARMDALAAGAIVALSARGEGGLAQLAKPARWVGLFAALGLALLVAVRGNLRHDDVGMITIGCTLLASLFGALLVMTLTVAPLGGVFSNAALRWFGKYSYGIYVWHPPIFVIGIHSAWARELRGSTSPLSAVLNMALVVAVAYVIVMASWSLYESQFLKLKRYFH